MVTVPAVLVKNNVDVTANPVHFGPYHPRFLQWSNRPRARTLRASSGLVRCSSLRERLAQRIRDFGRRLSAVSGQLLDRGEIAAGRAEMRRLVVAVSDAPSYNSGAHFAAVRKLGHMLLNIMARM